MGAEAPRGRVYLVGAGPGDPGLLTARALEVISIADTILYDRLIPDQALDGARADAELLFVGKGGHTPSMPQAQIEELLVEHARAGRNVVRLKGGDPFIFGRGGEALEQQSGAGRARHADQVIRRGIERGPGQRARRDHRRLDDTRAERREPARVSSRRR